MVQNIGITIAPARNWVPVTARLSTHRTVSAPDETTIRAMGTEQGCVISGSGRSVEFTITFTGHTGTISVGDSLAGDESGAQGIVLTTDDATFLTGYHPPIVPYRFEDEPITGSGPWSLTPAQITSVVYSGVGPSLGTQGGGTARTDTGTVRAPS